MPLVNGFVRRCGQALIAGALLAILANGLLTPLLASRHNSQLPETTGIYLLRQCASAFVALLLLFGSIGLHLAKKQRSGILDVVAFLAAFLGGCLLFAVEWADVFVLRTIAHIDPATFALLDRDAFSNIGFASAAGLFVLGWLLMSISLWRSGPVFRPGAKVTLSGLIAIPLLQAGPWKTVGAISGNLIFGAGLLILGRALVRLDFSQPDKVVDRTSVF
jgi:hypothetical protein